MYINFWYPAEWSDELTDKPIKAKMLGHNFVLFRDADGVAHCLSNTCVHRGGSLAGGKIVDGCVQCPYHGWRFGGDGNCQAIPSLGPGAKVPARARVDSYPTVERYGIVFTFLGDLPEEERPPIMEIPEYGEDGWYVHRSGRVSEGDYKRRLDNSLDPAHNEYVHPTHGFSGARDEYYVPELKVEDTEWGSGFITTYFAPPLEDEKMKAATGRTENAVIEAGTFHHGPSNLCTKIHPTADKFMHQNGFSVPIDENTVRGFLVQTRNFLMAPEHDARFIERNEVVASQDRVVLDDLEPFYTPETNAYEFLMPADRAIVRYREKLAEWQELGWRIDVETLNRERSHKAFAIPSPARRERPTGWVLDPAPMMPAEIPARVSKPRESKQG